MNIFVEGPSFAGKTSLLHALKENNSDIDVIDEHDIYSKGIDNYPPFPSRTVSQAVDNVDFFYDLEQQRHRDAQEKLSEVDKILFDRSIFSVILFQKYIRSLNLDDHSSAYEYAKKKAQDLIEDNLVSVPDAILYVTADYETVRSRYGREISVGLLRGQMAHAFFSDQYQAVLRAYRPYDLVKQIESTNSVDSMETNAEEINDKLKAWSEVKVVIEPQELALRTVETL